MAFNHLRSNIRNAMVGMTIVEARACSDTFAPTGYRPNVESRGYVDEFLHELEAECHDCSGCTYCEGTTAVVFLKDDDEGDDEGEVFAVFPALAATAKLISCYAHIGQHAGASLWYCDGCQEVTNPVDYNDLAEELERYGYKVRVVGKERIGIEFTDRFEAQQGAQ